MFKRRGELTKVSDLFAKYKDNIKAPQKTVVEATVEIVNEVAGIQLDSTKCQYNVSTRTLATNAPAIVKQEILRQHDDIIAHLKGRLGEKSAPLRII